MVRTANAAGLVLLVALAWVASPVQALSTVSAEAFGHPLCPLVDEPGDVFVCDPSDVGRVVVGWTVDACSDEPATLVWTATVSSDNTEFGFETVEGPGPLGEPTCVQVRGQYEELAGACVRIDAALVTASGTVRHASDEACAVGA